MVVNQSVLRDTPVGKLWLYEHDLIGMTLAGGQFWDGELLLPLFDAVKPGEIVINIGAYTGYEAIYLAEKRGARVLAVEANRDLYSMMVQNLNLHNLRDSVVPFNWVAYDHQGMFDFAPGQEELGSPAEKGNVGSLSFIRADPGDIYGGPLDPAIRRLWPPLQDAGVSLIECDVQGADLRALEGLEVTIMQYRPVIVFEYEHGLAGWHGDSWRDYERFFSRHRYDLQESKSHPRNFVGRPR